VRNLRGNGNNAAKIPHTLLKILAFPPADAYELRIPAMITHKMVTHNWRKNK
jgi:hypothetical protein